MKTYESIQLVTFLERPNRFIALCEKNDGEVIRVHVKNTGRCQELLIPGVLVAVNHQPFSHRKTHYDLVAVNKQGAWFNIDSQLPNKLVLQGLRDGVITLSQIKGNVINIQPEYTYGESRFDFFIETDRDEKILVEVKGMTLEHDEIGYFPDAPTLRGLKHVTGLLQASKEGFKVGVIFIAQFETIKYGQINEKIQPELASVIALGQKQDNLFVTIYNCHVTPSTVTIIEEKPFR